MVMFLLALAGLAIVDSLDVLLVAVTAMIVLDAQVARRSALPGALAFLGGVFAVTTVFGITTVLGVTFLADVFDFRVTPLQRYWAEILVGVVLLGLACLKLGQGDGPKLPPWASRVRRRPEMLALLGVAIGIGQAPTAVPYLAGLAMLSARDPRPEWWPAIIVVYCLLALLPPILIVAASRVDSARARRFQRQLVRGLQRYGPPLVRVIFLVAGIALIADGLWNYTYLW